MNAAISGSIAPATRMAWPGVPLDRQPPPDGTFGELELMAGQLLSVHGNQESSRGALRYSKLNRGGGNPFRPGELLPAFVPVPGFEIHPAVAKDRVSKGDWESAFDKKLVRGDGLGRHTLLVAQMCVTNGVSRVRSFNRGHQGTGQLCRSSWDVSTAVYQSCGSGSLVLSSTTAGLSAANASRRAGPTSSTRSIVTP